MLQLNSIKLLMKSIFWQIVVIFICIFSINESVKAQWFKQQVSDTAFGNYFFTNTVKFADANTGYAGGTSNIFGYSGYIYKTTNGGNNWADLAVSNLYSVWSMEVLSPTVVFASCDSATIRRTITGGLTWSTLNTPAVPTNTIVWKMSFINTLTGWITTDDASGAKTFQTINGGTTWTTVNSSTGFSKIKFFSATNGIAINSSGFFATTNSGANWTNLMSNTLLTEYYFLNNNTGWLFSKKSGAVNGKSWKTTNAGVNWNQLYANDTTSYTPAGVIFFDENTGYANYYNHKSGIIKTTNGGLNWFNPTDFRLTTNDGKLISDFANQSTGWFSTGGDFMYKTTNGPGNLVNPFFADYYKYQNTNNINNYTDAYGRLTAYSENSTSGLEYPKGSNNYCLFTSGLVISAVVNGDSLLSQSYMGTDFRPGKIDANGNETGSHSADYGMYQIKTGDGSGVPDYDRWPVLQGAPVSGSQPLLTGNQSSFVALTDLTRSGYDFETAPLKAEVKIYSYAFNDEIRKDAIYYKIDITNKNTAAWSNAFVSLIVDPDIGFSASDDKMGSDSALGLAYSYNGVITDPGYGANPPAVGYKVISATNGFALSSCVPFYNPGSGPPACEQDPFSLTGFLNYQKGLNRCGESYYYSGAPRKFVFNGDPQTGSGWNSPTNYDTRFFMSLGPSNLASGETATIIVAVLVARGTSNLNSVTKLKQYAAMLPVNIPSVNNYVPKEYKLNQNYPNPFNPVTKISYMVPKSSFVDLNIYDISGRLVKNLVSGNHAEGNYEVDFNGESLSSGIYFCRMNSENYSNSIKMILVK